MESSDAHITKKLCTGIHSPSNMAPSTSGLQEQLTKPSSAENETVSKATSLQPLCVSENLKSLESGVHEENAVPVENPGAESECAIDNSHLSETSQHDLSVSKEEDVHEETIEEPESLPSDLPENNDLNVRQKYVLNLVASRIEEKNKRMLLFVSGVAGTGKSYLIDHIKKWMNERMGNGSVVICAPISQAAFPLQGSTLHRLLSLPFGYGDNDRYDELDKKTENILSEKLEKTMLVIIDVANLISSVQLAYIHKRLCEIKGNTKPFGALNILLFGDFLQLPPMNGEPLFEPLDFKTKSRFSIDSIGLWPRFEYYELTQNMRHDENYARILFNIRIGYVSETDADLLRDKLIPHIYEKSIDNAVEFCTGENKNPPEVALFPDNNSRKLFNNKMLGGEDMPIHIIRSNDIFETPIIEGEMLSTQNELQVISNNKRKTGGLETELQLTERANVIITHNIDLENGLIQGARGRILRIEHYNNDWRINVQLNNIAKPVWIYRTSAQFTLTNNILVNRHQFPLTLVYALTIHNSTGMNLENAVIDIGNSVHRNGLSYVALSRIKSLNELHLISFDKTKIQVYKTLVDTCNQLRQRFCGLPNLEPFV